MESKTNVLDSGVDMERMLSNGLTVADKFINRNYLIDISDREVIKIDDEIKRYENIRLYEITKLVYDREENINDKLISVYSGLHSIESSALLMIVGTKEKISIYIGAKSKNTVVAGDILRQSFESNFPGSEIRLMSTTETESLMSGVVMSGEEREVSERRGEFTGYEEICKVSAVTVIPSDRTERKEKYIQGMEKFIDAMQGVAFTALFIADPVGKESLEIYKRGFEELHSVLSPFIKTTFSYGQNNSDTVTEGRYKNFATTLNSSITNTMGISNTRSHSVTGGRSSGTGFGFANFGKQRGWSDGYSFGETWSKAVSEGKAKTSGEGYNEGTSKTTGDSRTFTLECKNKSIEYLSETIENQLKRVRSCEAFGVWEYSGYFIAEDVQTVAVAANTYKALMLGENTSVENSFINIWSENNREKTKDILEYLKYAEHPLIGVDNAAGFDTQIVTPCNFISGKELPMLLGIPQKSVPGLSVVSMAEFGRNVFLNGGRDIRNPVGIGTIYHMGKKEYREVKLDLDSFRSHCFITGTTGCGKSNTVYCLIEQMINNKIPFLVVEPAKGEYKNVFGGLENVNIFSTNPEICQMLKINPFKFDKGIHILEHLDRLVEIFNACWEMYAAMPAILKEAMEKAYIMKGWDIYSSRYVGEGEACYPDFRDLLGILPDIIENSRYSSETKGDYSGALITRVASLTNGINGQVFCDSYDIDDSILFDNNAIIDLSRVGSVETKSLLMGILVLKLSEYRMANADGADAALKHVTVIEEAHNLLKNVSVNQQQDQANLIGKSVEMISSSIAEMRTYGEGFIIIDQSPTAVDSSAIKNTNTKIIMRLPDKTDCEIASSALSLNQNQTMELPKLAVGVAAVMQNNWMEPVLCQIDRFTDKYEKIHETVPYEKMRAFRSNVVNELIRQYVIGRKPDTEAMALLIKESDISEDKKKEMISRLTHVYKNWANDPDIEYFCKTLLSIIECSALFDILEFEVDNPQNDEEALLWLEQFTDRLNDYIELDEDYVTLATECLLWIRRDSMTYNYLFIYDTLIKYGEWE